LQLRPVGCRGPSVCHAERIEKCRCINWISWPKQSTGRDQKNTSALHGTSKTRHSRDGKMVSGDKHSFAAKRTGIDQRHRVSPLQKTGQMKQNGTSHDGRAFVGRTPSQNETPFVDSPSGRANGMIHLGRPEKCVRHSRHSHQKVLRVCASKCKV
jgi:hypothetical protein